jgi:hypothetical protein
MRTVPSVKIGLRVKQNIVGDISVLLTGVILAIRLLACNEIAEIRWTKDLIHNDLNRINHLRVKMNVD